MKNVVLDQNIILTYSHAGVVERIGKEANVNVEKAQSIFQDTLRFLLLAAETGENLVPTKSIDIGWHTFILFTKDYIGFCNNHLGRFIHHNPTTSRSKPLATDLRVRTFELASHRFGKDLSENWRYEMTSSAECDKSGCNCSPDTGGGGEECTPE